MKLPVNAGLLLNAVLCWAVSGKSVAKDGEIEVKLQFLEYELEDFCVSKSEAEWRFLNGTDHDLKKFLDVELKESEFYKHELEVLQKHVGKKFSSKRLQRLMDVFSHPGAPLLGTMEFKEYRDYSIKLQELLGTMKIPCLDDVESTPSNDSTTESISQTNSSKCNPIDYKSANKILYREKSEEKLKDLWIKWYKELEDKNKKTKYDFVQQLSILDLEAEQNGEEELPEYWLKQSDTTWADYETAKNLWKEILPLYEKLKHFIKSLITQNFGANLLSDEKLIPAHVLGSLITYEWLTAAEKLKAFDSSEAYKSFQSFLKQKKLEELYKMADNQTADMKFGHLPQNFYEKSRFNISSQRCQHKMMDYCERENVHRAMFCAGEVPTVRDYIQIHENVMKIKYHMLSGKEEEENGYLFREGPRESALHEAMEGLSSLWALRPEALDSQEIMGNHSQQQKTVLTLLITALHVIPPLPYYLATDLWRINALKEIDATVGENSDTTTLPVPSSTLHSLGKREAENQSREETVGSTGTPGDVTNTQEGESNGEATKTYDTQNLTRDWWRFREQYQSIVPPDGRYYEDYLQDTRIIWNKPYLSKFLGKILQFQILEKSENLSQNLLTLQAMMQKGKSEPWQDIVNETFNITEISVQPLLKYFKPLEDFLEKGIKIKNNAQLFSFDELDFISQGFSLNAQNNEGEGEKPAESSDALFFSLAVIAAVGVVAFIVTIGRRRYKRRQRARERKRRLAKL